MFALVPLEVSLLDIVTVGAPHLVVHHHGLIQLLLHVLHAMWEDRGHGCPVENSTIILCKEKHDLNLIEMIQTLNLWIEPGIKLPVTKWDSYGVMVCLDLWQYLFIVGTHRGVTS